MPQYNYQGRDQSGKKIKGTYEADNVEAVVSYLEARAIIPVDITISHIHKLRIPYFFTFSNFRPQEVLNFARQMAILISAGVPIIKAVQQLAQTARSKLMRQTLAAVTEGLEAGKSMADTLREHPRVFSGIFVSLVAVGEQIGHLDDIFARLADFLEQQAANRRRFIAAVRYPMIVVVSILVALLIMNIFVVPKFATMFSRFGEQLPLPTRILVAVSNFMVNHWGLLLICTIGAIVAVRYALTIAPIRLVWDKYKLKFPVIGDLQKRIMLAQFTQTLSMILFAGVPILKGFTLAANAAENFYVTDQLLKMRTAISHGEKFSYAASLSNLFDPTVLQMLEVGEETGKLDTMLTKVSAAYTDEIDYRLKNLSDLLEPMLLAVVGVLIGLMALAIYLPMWDIVKFAR